jgi:hypothetical protein
MMPKNFHAYKVDGLTIHGVERVEEAINLVRGLG